MDRVKNKLAFCFAFQDDLEVASRTDKEHRQHLISFSSVYGSTVW
jgi:hypothetical protein